MAAYIVALLLVAQLRCADDAAYRILDFWVGRWTVMDSAGRRVGSDVVQKRLRDCAIVEEWYGTQGDRGMSLFFFNRDERRWKQVWVEDDAVLPGGVREKHLVALYRGGGVRFAGEWRGPSGRTVLNRTTLTPVSHDRVHQLIESSSDGGTTWVAGFDAVYVRQSSSGPAARKRSQMAAHADPARTVHRRTKRVSDR